ncbi:ATP-binding protein (plasmid) [Streptomyces avidinii]|uniref:hypothetical protein n=1 Tax=Streptomyces avidinii TaxID=1895 RepID=UPI002F913F61|nr:ATP-binding protein [Streptomyces avidinii]
MKDLIRRVEAGWWELGFTLWQGGCPAMVSRRAVDTVRARADGAQGIGVREAVPAEPDYATLIGKLVEYRAGPLAGKPSDRTLAAVVGSSPTTIGNWLNKGQFPQASDQLLKLVNAVRAQAVLCGMPATHDGVALLDGGLWQRAHQAEARRRAGETRSGVEAAQARAVLDQVRPGRPLTEVTDPLQLEVHRAIAARGADLPVLPLYIEREHDRTLADAVERAAGGESRIALLVGGSSTGKTRALWEALARLRERHESWRLWHPISPDALLAQLNDVGPYTVIWLNEAQEYLDRGERVASGLRTLLHDPSRAPALILATLWPEHWNKLTARTEPDRHRQARELLAGQQIRLPNAFIGADLAALHETAGHDTRLREAATHARDGQIAQYLAGGLVLLDRYHNAPPPARALVHAAMDARRLGAGPRIPWTWLANAASGYPTDTEWEAFGDDWDNHLVQALAYVTERWNGIPGILSPVHTDTTRNQRPTRSGATSKVGQPAAKEGPSYRLADYLDQHGRRERAEHIPPVGFWTSAAQHAHPTDLATLGDAARNRGLYRDAAQLYKNATPYQVRAAVSLVHHFDSLHPHDHRPAQWAATQMPFDGSLTVLNMPGVLRKAGAEEQIAVLVARAVNEGVLGDSRSIDVALSLLGRAGVGVRAQLAEQVAVLAARAVAERSLDNAYRVVYLLEALQEVGAREQVAALAARAAVEVSLTNAEAVAQLIGLLREAGAEEEVAVLIRRAAAEVSLTNTRGVAGLMDLLREAGAEEEVAVLVRRAAAEVSLTNPGAVARLMDLLREAGAEEEVAVLVRRAAAEASLDDPNGIAALMRVMQEVGAEEQVAALAARAAAEASLDDLNGIAVLMRVMQELGAEEQVAALAAHAAAGVALDDEGVVGGLLDWLQSMGAKNQVTVLAERAVAGVTLDGPYAATELLGALWQAGARDQVAALATRVAAEACLDGPHAAATLLGQLREVRAWEEVAVLAGRAAAEATLADPYVVALLLDQLQSVGAGEAVAVLARRAAAEACLDDAHAVTELLYRLQGVGAGNQAAVLARRAAAGVSLDDPHAVAGALGALWQVGAGDQVAALARRAAHAVAIDTHCELAELLDLLRGVGAEEQATVLAHRAAEANLVDPRTSIGLLDELWHGGAGDQVVVLARRAAKEAVLDDPRAAAVLLDQLQKVGAGDQVVVLARRAAKEAVLDDPYSVSELLFWLRKSGEVQQVAMLTKRWSATGHLSEVVRFGDGREPIPFGYEPDGGIAPSWTWDDLQ